VLMLAAYATPVEGPQPGPTPAAARRSSAIQLVGGGRGPDHKERIARR